MFGGKLNILRGVNTRFLTGRIGLRKNYKEEEKMGKKFQRLMSVRWVVVMLACAAGLAGCGRDTSPPSGAVVQGPVAGQRYSRTM